MMCIQINEQLLQETEAGIGSASCITAIGLGSNANSESEELRKQLILSRGFESKWRHNAPKIPARIPCRLASIALIHFPIRAD